MKRKRKYKPVVNSYLPGAPVREDSAKSQKCIKYLYSVLSVITFMVLMSFFYQLGSGIMKNQLTAEINSWKRRAIEAEKVIEDVEKVEKAMRRFIPKEDRRRKEAAIFVGKARAFGLPLKVAMVSAEAETCYNINAKGPFGEKGTHQAMYATMRRYFPKCDGSLIYWEVASWLHLQDCFEKSGRNLFLTLAYHNSGTNRTPLSAYRVAWKHVNRCRRIARGLSV
jgi:hypothetical protein